jgi:hypothetical protein
MGHYFKKKRHAECLCGTGNYCHHHMRYGLEQHEQTRDFIRQGTVHLIPTEDLGRHKCGGGIRVVKAKIQST